MLVKLLASFRFGAAALVLSTTAGLAAGQTLTDGQQADLLGRVEARWEALEQRNMGAVYAFQSPAYRAVFTKEMYAVQPVSTRAQELTSVEILNYDAGAAVASVAVGVMSRPVKQTSAASAAIDAKPVTVIEQWILRNNQWWFSVLK